MERTVVTGSWPRLLAWAFPWPTEPHCVFHLTGGLAQDRDGRNQSSKAWQRLRPSFCHQANFATCRTAEAQWYLALLGSGAWRRGLGTPLGRGFIEAVPSTLPSVLGWPSPLIAVSAPQREELTAHQELSNLRQRKKNHYCDTCMHTKSFPLLLLKLLPCVREDAEGLRSGGAGARRPLSILKGLCSVWIQAICF